MTQGVKGKILEWIFRRFFLKTIRVVWGKTPFLNRPYAKIYFGKSKVSHVEAIPNMHGFEIKEVTQGSEMKAPHF